jgi:hypothetical protein
MKIPGIQPRAQTPDSQSPQTPSKYIETKSIKEDTHQLQEHHHNLFTVYIF